jgi:hypothetical protein
MLNLDTLVDLARIKSSGAKSLRDYIRKTLFEEITKAGFTLQELADYSHIPYETLVRYLSGSLPMSSAHVTRLNGAVAINQTDLIPIKPLTKNEKMALWQECKQLQIVPVVACSEEERTEAFCNARGPYDLEIEAVEFQPAITATRIQKKLDDPNYNILV